MQKEQTTIMTADDRGPTTWEEIRNECETCKEIYTTSEMGTLFYILREENRQIDLVQIPVYTIRSIPSHLDHVTIIRSVYRGILGQRRFNQSYMDNGFHHLSSSLPCLFRLPFHDAIMVLGNSSGFSQIDGIQFGDASVYDDTPIFFTNPSYICRLFAPRGQRITTEALRFSLDMALELMASKDGSLNIYSKSGQLYLQSLFSEPVCKRCLEFLGFVSFKNVQMSNQQLELLQNCRFSITFENVDNVSLNFLRRTQATAITFLSPVGSNILKAIGRRPESSLITRLILHDIPLLDDQDALQSLMLALNRVVNASLRSFTRPVDFETWKFIWKAMRTNCCLQGISFVMIRSDRDITADYLVPIQECLRENHVLETTRIDGTRLSGVAAAYWSTFIQPSLDANRDSKFPPILLNPEASTTSHRFVVTAALFRYKPHVGKRYKLLRKYVDLFFPTDSK